jgi:hypothetical protein
VLICGTSATDGLWNRQGGSADNIDKTFTLNLSSGGANDTWALQLRDAALLNGGYITPGRSIRRRRRSCITRADEHL